MLTVRCPKCHHDQLCDPRISQETPTVVGKKKRCVYCGMTFSIHSNMECTNIVAIGKVADPNKAF
jgi:hypothetical protein